MLLTKKSEGIPAAGPRLRRFAGARLSTMDRRTFLKRSGLAAGAGAFASQLPYGTIGKAEANGAEAGKAEVKRTVCTHCSVGCSIDATVENGVWTRQDPVFDSPLNLGAHCAKGASVREHGHGEHRLKAPMKLVDGKWTKISWEQAINEVGDKILAIRKESGPDAIFWVGSSKHSNEQSYLMRKFVSFFGSNNCDHQARICHSTTVAGVANTWGYGAMTNSYNDMQNTKCAMYIGSNAAEAHPVSMLHMLHAKETGAKMIVVDPRFTRTAAKADYYVRLRSGTDIPFIFGMLHHIFKNGWEDKEYIHDRVYGMDKVREEVLTKWTPDKVEEACGVPEAQVLQIAELMAKNKPSTVVWILQLALGNIGIAGGGANIFRGHDNVQGATDVGPNPDSLPGYYGIAAGSWKHWAAVWGVDYNWLSKQFAPGMMEKSGMTVSRWIDGVLEKNELIDQDSNLRALVFWGHAPNSQTRGKEMVEAMKKLDLLVVIDPYPSATAAMAAMVRKDGVYLLPAATQFETSGSVTASNRSLQWRERVISPLFESQTDQAIMYQFAKKFGWDKEFAKNYQIWKPDPNKFDEPTPESLLKEINKGTWTIGYTGQSPERLKLHMKNQNTFDVKTLRAKGGPCDGDYYGLPWPCYGNPELKHPGSPKAAEGKNWKTDLSGGIQRVVLKNHGCHPFGNAKARAIVWNFPDGIPQHREPLYSPRPDMVAKYPTHDDKKAFWRLPTLYKSVQEQNKDISKQFPLVLTSGRLVEYEGGGEETRSNPWLAELQQENFVEINPKDANDRGVRDGEYVWVKTPTGAQLKVKAQVTERVASGTTFIPFHFSGWWMGKDMLQYYPEGAAPIVRGEAVNTATTYGYDSVTMMQETKTTLCEVQKFA